MVKITMAYIRFPRYLTMIRTTIHTNPLDPDADAPYAYRSYHYHPQYTGYSYRQCAKFHTYNPLTHTYIGKDGLPHHC